MAHEDVPRVQTLMCQFGTTSRIGGIGSELGPVLKPTGFMTSSPCIAREFARLCPRDHVEVPLVGGRAAGAAIYPEKRCVAICRGLANQKREMKTMILQTLPMPATRLSSRVCFAAGRLGATRQISLRMASSLWTTSRSRRTRTGFTFGKSRTFRPAGVTNPRGDWPAHWSDVIHEFDGHGIGVEGAV